MAPQAASRVGQASLIAAGVLHLGASTLLFAPWPYQDSEIEIYPVSFVSAAWASPKAEAEDQIAALVESLDDLPAESLDEESEEALLEEGEPLQVPPPKPLRRIELPEVLTQPDPLQPTAVQLASERAYLAVVTRRLQASLREPHGARGAKGRVVVGFVVTAGGAVEASWIASSSGNGLLDREALAALQRVSPFAPLPDSLGKQQLVVKQPLTFGGP